MRSQVLPWACEGVRLDGDVLEIGPGYGAATRWLLEHGGHLTAVEGDPKMVADLSNEFGEQCRRPQRRALIPLPRQPAGTALTDSPHPLPGWGRPALIRCVGWPAAHPADKIEYARLLQDLDQIASKTAIPKTSLHRYLTDVDR